jgi:hypothetical protein
MPCSDNQENWGPTPDQIKIDKLTQMLCGLCRTIENEDQGFINLAYEQVNGLEKWWKNHKIWDEMGEKDAAT